MPVNILVVNDSEAERLIIQNTLSEHCIFTARDVVEAVRILEEHDEINLLILDLALPDRNGFSLLESIREDERFRKLRTIILTDYDELENEIIGLKLGAVDYIRKPIHCASLKARIDVHIEQLLAEQASEHLHEKALTFDMIFEQAPIGIAISYKCDPNRSDDDFVKINSIFEEITGRTKEELISLGLAGITHPDDLEENKNKFRKLQSGEIKTFSMDKRYIKPDGSIVWVHIIVAPLISADGQQYGYIHLVQDITERKTFEQALNESERSKSVLLSHLPGLAYRCYYDREWTMQYVSKGCFQLTVLLLTHTVQQ